MAARLRGIAQRARVDGYIAERHCNEDLLKLDWNKAKTKIEDVDVDEWSVN